VVPLELFFDLVFVFALTQITGLLASEPTWAGLGRGLAVIAAIWWAWVGYTWLGTAVDPEEGWVRFAFFAAIAAMFFVALATRDPFGRDAVLFAAAYLAVRAIHVGVFLAVARHDAAFRRSIVSMVPSFIGGPILLIVAAYSSDPPRAALWAVALLIDFGGPLLGGADGWRMTPAHFTERHGLIVIIAIGESIVSVGVGIAEADLTAPRMWSALALISLTCALWWIYFDVVAIVGERTLSALRGREQNELARDSYSYLHLPMVCGIVLLALAAKSASGEPTKALSMVKSTALFGGVAMYLLALSLFRLRNLGHINIQRIVAAAVLIAVIPVGHRLEGAWAVAMAAAVVWMLVLFELNRFSELRRQIRSELKTGDHPSQPTPSAPGNQGSHHPGSSQSSS
jgi:low temperature requirement protein LtrA